MGWTPLSPDSPRKGLSTTNLLLNRSNSPVPPSSLTLVEPCLRVIYKRVIYFFVSDTFWTDIGSPVSPGRSPLTPQESSAPDPPTGGVRPRSGRIGPGWGGTRDGSRGLSKPVGVWTPDLGCPPPCHPSRPPCPHECPEEGDYSLPVQGRSAEGAGATGSVFPGPSYLPPSLAPRRRNTPTESGQTRRQRRGGN